VVSVRDTLVPVFVTVTVAPATLAPDGSVTLPKILPKLICENAGAQVSSVVTVAPKMIMANRDQTDNPTRIDSIFIGVPLLVGVRN